MVKLAYGWGSLAIHVVINLIKILLYFVYLLKVFIFNLFHSDAWFITMMFCHESCNLSKQIFMHIIEFYNGIVMNIIRLKL